MGTRNVLVDRGDEPELERLWGPKKKETYESINPLVNIKVDTKTATLKSSLGVSDVRNADNTRRTGGVNCEVPCSAGRMMNRT